MFLECGKRRCACLLVLLMVTIFLQFIANHDSCRTLRLMSVLPGTGTSVFASRLGQMEVDNDRRRFWLIATKINKGATVQFNVIRWPGTLSEDLRCVNASLRAAMRVRRRRQVVQWNALGYHCLTLGPMVSPAWSIDVLLPQCMPIILPPSLVECTWTPGRIHLSCLPTESERAAGRHARLHHGVLPGRKMEVPEVSGSPQGLRFSPRLRQRILHRHAQFSTGRHPAVFTSESVAL